MATNEATRFFIAGPDEDGKRMDAALAVLYPELGLRARRRLWEWCRVSLDGRPAGPGAYVRAGQGIEVRPLEAVSPVCSGLSSDLRIVAAMGGFCAVNKPAGLPSARIGGGKNQSAEELVRAGWPRLSVGWKDLPADPPLLCNRLDTATSGLLLWALNKDDLARFRSLEASGAVEKRYYALVEGEAPAEMRLDRALNMARREKTLVLDCPDPDAARHSLARRLSAQRGPDAPRCLLDVLIRRGARHQIRAHLAAAGYPIVGDALYGVREGASGPLYLHHYRISFFGFSAELAPDWVDAEGNFKL